MPQHKSAEKRIRTSERQRDRNRSIRTRVRGAVRKFEEGAPESQADLLRQAASELDKAVRKGVIKEATANRKKSRLAKQLNKAAKPKE
ncbi:MAG: 30S ribosomal protein S20 [Candidatus Eisenbacteria bacterium]|nr:30S ribosomal protein S20 [Candidatus Eisenbacteria bacterium]